jgi:hypothetical protein
MFFMRNSSISGSTLILTLPKLRMPGIGWLSNWTRLYADFNRKRRDKMSAPRKAYPVQLVTL